MRVWNMATGKIMVFKSLSSLLRTIILGARQTLLNYPEFLGNELDDSWQEKLIYFTKNIMYIYMLLSSGDTC